MSNAQPGHGALIAMEQLPLTTPGVFTTIAELASDIIFPEIIRSETEVTPHQDSIDSWVLGVPKRGAITFTVNFIYNDATHDHLTGAYKSIKGNEKRGFRIRGPLGAAGVDEWIMSGQISAINNNKSPIRQGVRTADITVRFSGAMIIGGIVYLS